MFEPKTFHRLEPDLVGAFGLALTERLVVAASVFGQWERHSGGVAVIAYVASVIGVPLLQADVLLERLAAAAAMGGGRALFAATPETWSELGAAAKHVGIERLTSVDLHESVHEWTSGWLDGRVRIPGPRAHRETDRGVEELPVSWVPGFRAASVDDDHVQVRAVRAAYRALITMPNPHAPMHRDDLGWSSFGDAARW